MTDRGSSPATPNTPETPETPETPKTLEALGEAASAPDAERPEGHADRAEPAGREVALPRLGWRGSIRFVWAQLTSMRTALVLLFALALAAVPGSLVPQRPVSPIRVSDFIAANPTLGRVYDQLGLFSVYTSPWFSAIYLLLFVSLIGCILPRVGVYARALRAQPPQTPRNLSRLPAYTRRDLATDTTTGDDQDTALPGASLSAGENSRAVEVHRVLDEAAADLRRQRYRVRIVTGPMGPSVAAERGYLREAGNLVFHISLLVGLVGVAVGALWGYRASSVVVVGQGFSNTITQFDDFAAGGWFRSSGLRPFTIKLLDFRVRFETGQVQTGAARLFEADVEVAEPGNAGARAEKLEVNKPAVVAGSKVHLIGHGYAPIVTVKDSNGNVAWSGPVVFLPQDGNFTSAGAIKAPDARPQRLGFQGFFLPAASVDEAGATRSVFPDAVNPELFLNVWYGPPRQETGRPENVYSLDTTGLTRLTESDGTPVRLVLSPGRGVELPNGLGSVQFDGWTRWVKLQVSDTPGAPITLAALATGIAGLCLSLFVRPRRVWVRVSRQEAATISVEGQELTRPSSTTTDTTAHTETPPSLVIEVGGLDRADARGGLIDDVDDLTTRLSAHFTAKQTR